MKCTKQNMVGLLQVMNDNTMRLIESTSDKTHKELMMREVLAVDMVISMMTDEQFLNDMAHIYKFD